jgi:hypothetical protein
MGKGERGTRKNETEMFKFEKGAMGDPNTFRCEEGATWANHGHTIVRVIRLLVYPFFHAD